MRSATFFAILAVALTAVLAIPVSHHSHHKALPVPAKAAPVSIFESKTAVAKPQDALEDLIVLIGALLGINVPAIVKQVPLTIEGVEAALTEAVDQLLALLEQSDAQLAEKLNAAVANAVAQAGVILAPLLEVIAKLTPKSGSKAVIPQNLLDDLLKIIIGYTLKELEQLVVDTFTQLEQLVVDTIAEIQQIALESSVELAAEVAAILNAAVGKVQAAVDPLLELLKPLLPKGRAVAAKPQDALEDLIVLIGALLGINVPAIVKQVPLTIEGVEAALTEAVDQLLALLEQADAQLAEKLNAAVANAVAQAGVILAPLLEVIAKLTPKSGSHAVIPQNLLDDLLKIIIGYTLKELEQLVVDTFTQLEQLVVDTIAEIQQIALESSVELAAEVAAILNATVGKVQAAVDPLLELLKPLLPKGRAVAAKPQDALEDLIVLIGALLGINVPAIVKQVPLTIEGVEAALTEAVNELLALLEQADAELAEKLNAAVANAVAQAGVILAPLLEVIAKLTPKSGSHAVIPQNLLDDLLKIIIGYTLKELEQLVVDTFTQLEQLVVDTIAQIQQIALESSVELAAEVAAILDAAIGKVQAAVDPLLELLKPLLPKKHAVAAKPQDALEDLIVLIGALLGINVPAIVKQVPLTIEGVEAALTEAVDQLLALLEQADAELAEKLNAAVANAVAQAGVILAPLLEVIAKLTPKNGNKAIIPQNLLDDLLKIIIGYTLKELEQLVVDTFTQLEQLVVDTIAEIQQIALESSAELAAEVAAILNATVGKVQAAVDPLLELLEPLLPKGSAKALIQSPIVFASLGEIIAQFEATLVGINNAIKKANDELNEALTEHGLYAPIEEILMKAQEDSDKLIRDAIAKVPGLTLEQIGELITQTISEYKVIQALAAGQVQEIILNSGVPGLFPKIQQISQTMVDEVNAQLQALLDLIKPPTPTEATKLFLH